MATSDSNEKAEIEIFHKLLDVVPDLMTIEQAGKSTCDGYMDLNLDVLQHMPGSLVIALSHYYRHPSGDMIADPDMEIAVSPSQERARALTYQDAFGYQSVEMLSGEKAKNCQRHMNSFLSQWLSNLIAQGHRIDCEHPLLMPDAMVAARTMSEGIAK